MDVIKVVVENWPKAKPLLLEWAPIIIAGIAIMISVYSIHLSTKGFIASHRPYVWLSTFSYLRDNKIVTDINTLAKLCVNAPAEIIREEYAYITITKDDNGKDCQNNIHTETLNSRKGLIYPVDPKTNQLTYTIGFNLEPEIANQETKLFRKTRIDYKEISSKRKYFFEGKWEYNRQGTTWKPINLIGN